MSNPCDTCNCDVKNPCPKKATSYSMDIVETESSYMSTVVMDVPVAEHDGKCKCGPSCACVNCTCGH